MKKLFESKKLVAVAGFLGLYLVVAGISWAVFSYVGGGSSGLSGGNNLEGLAKDRAKISELPKTEECPINGEMFTKVEKDIWSTRRPLTAMIENHYEARPYFGLTRADVMYEAVAEGGITRYLGVFYCAASTQDFRIAAVRSARVYFVKWAAEYGDFPIFLHWGGANNIDNNNPSGVKYKGAVAPEVDAFLLLDKLGWRNGRYGNDLDGQSNIGVPVIKRLNNRLGPDKQLAAEHTPTAYVDEVFKEAESRGFAYKDSDGNAWDENFREWKFADDAPLSSPKATDISFEFWRNKPEYDVRWVYEPSTNSYKRFNGADPTVDGDNNNKQVEAKDIVIQFLDERGPVDKELHMYYENVGDGDIILFQNGDVIKGTWEKDDIFGRTLFYNENGDEIKFVRGQIWIEGIPNGNDVVY
jgi:hypothetical protein